MGQESRPVLAKSRDLTRRRGYLSDANDSYCCTLGLFYYWYDVVGQPPIRVTQSFEDAVARDGADVLGQEIGKLLLGPGPSALGGAFLDDLQLPVDVVDDGLGAPHLLGAYPDHESRAGRRSRSDPGVVKGGDIVYHKGRESVPLVRCRGSLRGVQGGDSSGTGCVR